MNKQNDKQMAIRCAIYTRKSTDEGLEQEFNSLDAQRDAGEAYIASQKSEGWVCLPDRYDDGGFTGGNMDRPAMKRLLADIEAGRIDCIVVYKIDRLSRSLMDFARVMETFEKHSVSFVSVTQQFNTSTSMGRLMLNVLLSFAQFEREIISERTRDKIAATRRKGKWTGGPPSSHTGLLRRLIFFGYDRSRRSVVIGPQRLNQKIGDAPHALEHGGTSTVIEGLRGKRKKRRVKMAARPYMGPAFEQEKPKLAAMWRDSIR